MTLNINATNFSGTLSAGFTRDQYIAFMKGRFLACGFTNLTERVNATLHVLAYTISLNPSATYGTVILVLEIGVFSSVTLAVTLRLFAQQNYNLTTFTGTTNTHAQNQTVSVIITNTYTMFAIPVAAGVDYTGLAVVENGSTSKYFMGIDYPGVKESWYNEDSWVYAGLVDADLPNTAALPYPNPLNVAATTVVNRRCQISTFSGRNPVNNKIQLVLAPYNTLQAWGIDSQYSSNVALCNSTGYFINDVLVKEEGVEEYWLLWPGDNGIAVRCV